MISFSCTVLVTWEGVLVYVTLRERLEYSHNAYQFYSLFATGFINGGTAGLVWQFILVWGGTLSTFVTIGELASMAPTAGGQYHWVNMLAPKWNRNFLSYITGWMTCLAWVATIATGAFLSASMIQALCLINWPDYANVYAGWQGTLISWAVVLVCVFFNTVVGSLLPKVEGSFMMLHVLGFFAILIPLVYYAPKATADEVFNSVSSYQNAGMWPTYGTAFMVGTLGAAFSFVGADAAVHVSKDEQLSLPEYKLLTPALDVGRDIQRRRERATLHCAQHHHQRFVGLWHANCHYLLPWRPRSCTRSSVDHRLPLH